MKLPPDRGRSHPYWINILIGFDQFIGTLWGISADETVSSWAGRNKPDGWLVKLINRLFRDPDHCRNSIENHRPECR